MPLDQIPTVLKIKIGTNLNPTDLLTYLIVNYQLYNKPEFWRQLIKRDYPISWVWSFQTDPKTLYRKLRDDTNLKYPQELYDVFHKNDQYIFELPIMDLGQLSGVTDYVDFIDPTDMDAPIMRFTDKWLRKGIVLRLTGISDEQLSIGTQQITISDIAGTVAIFQRFTHNTSRWSLGWGNSDSTIERIYNFCHQRDAGHSRWSYCDQCPFNDTRRLMLGLFNVCLLDNLLNGSDRLFSAKH